MDIIEGLGKFVEDILPAVTTLFVIVITYVSLRLKAATERKVDNDYANGLLQRLNEVVRDVVLELEQTEADALRRAVDEDSPGGRAITKEEAIGLRDKAIERIKKYYGVEGLNLLLQILGVSPQNSNSWLGSKVERAVYEVKRGSF